MNKPTHRYNYYYRGFHIYDSLLTGEIIGASRNETRVFRATTVDAVEAQINTYINNVYEEQERKRQLHILFEQPKKKK